MDAFLVRALVFCGAAVALTGCQRPSPKAPLAPSASAAIEKPAPASLVDPQARKDLDAEITARMKEARIPGVAVVAFKGDAVLLSEGYGYADLATKRAMTPDDLFLVASISKTVTATALLQKAERGAIALDDDVDKHAPFVVRNPNFPKTPITYRMLLTHTSSITDTEELDDHLVEGSDSPEPLAEFLSNYLVPEGDFYAADHWSDKKPGSAYDYSNVAIALEGAIDEKLAGASLDDDCQAHIFKPLGMAESSWSLTKLDPKHLATLYSIDEDKVFVPLKPYGFPDYPDAQLRTSALQLSVFARMLLDGGTFQHMKILEKKTVDAMLTPQVPDLEPSQGLALYWEDFGDYHLVGHSGSYDGVSTDMFFDPESKVGFVMFANSDVYLRDVESEETALEKLEVAVLDFAWDAK